MSRPVQSHWDREGKYDDKSSCWIRVMQPWAGAGWGHQFIPRIGQEVVVVFEGGDPDKPMVLGALYNGTHPPPFRLPGDKTRSGIRTQSTPGARGANELSFQDAAGKEQVYLHAQRDLDEEVRHRHTTVVGEDQDNEVHGHQRNEVTGDQRERVGGSREGEIHKDQREHVFGEQQIRVEKDHTTVVGGNRTIRVGGISKHVVDGDAVFVFRDGCAVRIDGHASTTVGTEGDAGKSEVHVYGDHVLGAEGSLTVVAKKGITIQCGDSILSLGPDGLKIGAKSLALAGAEGLRMKGPGPAMTLGDEAEIVAKVVKIFSEGASLELSKDALLRGDKVLLNCDTAEPPEEDEETGKTKTKPLKVKLSDVALAAIAGKKYKLVVDGNLYEGTTGAGGEVEQEIPEAATSGTVTVWTEDYPEGPRQQWNLRFKELAPASSPVGAALRLRNLGYFSGVVSDDMKDLPESAVTALNEFQKDHGLPPSGKLDGDAAQKLADVYGQ